MNHTPEPWTIAYEDDDGNEYDNGVRIDSPEEPVAFNVIDCSAHLIAAAPELLAALIGLVNIVSDDPNDYPDMAAYRQAKKCEQAGAAAIAKAEGRRE